MIDSGLVPQNGNHPHSFRSKHFPIHVDSREAVGSIGGDEHHLHGLPGFRSTLNW